MSRSRNFVFTHNNYSVSDIQRLMELKGITYGKVAEEIGNEKKTPHLQGWIRFKNAKTNSSAIKILTRLFGKQPTVEPKRGDDADNDSYIGKERDRPIHEWGEYKQGKRSDVESYVGSVIEGKKDWELVQEYPREFAKFPSLARRVREAKRDYQIEQNQERRFKDVELREWQKDCINRLEAQNDREILWIYDSKGNRGKTWLTDWLQVHKKAYIISAGTAANIAHGYENQDWIAFDFSRTKEETVNYQVIEDMKNGRIFSPKYDSKWKRAIGPTHVVVMSNWYPDISKLSEDRWVIVDLSQLDK